MAFCFDRKDRDIRAGFRRIAAEQIDKALHEADEATGDAVREAIHSVRKRCKRLRGLVRLVRFSFPDYARENAAIRDVAAGLSHLRDADVLGETLEKVATAPGEALDPGAVEKVKAFLAERRNQLKAGQDEAAALRKFREDMRAVRKRVDRWQLKREGFDAISEGFGDVYRRCRRDMRLIEEDPSSENFHDWRKQVKYHFYHLCLLRNVAPHVLASQRELANELGEMLGSQHDVAIFLGVLADSGDLLEQAQAEGLRSILERRQQEFGDQAFRLGNELAAERTSCIVERVGTYWANWSRGGEDGGARDRAQVPRAA